MDHVIVWNTGKKLQDALPYDLQELDYCNSQILHSLVNLFFTTGYF